MTDSDVQIDTLALLAVANETPFFAIDVDAVAKRHCAVIAAWGACFPRFRSAYSYKTNSLPIVTRTLRALGACAEVVSGRELDWAVADGHSGSSIFFDGPVKRDDELRAALRIGASVQIDSLEELLRVCRAMVERRSSSRVLLRLSTRRPEGWSRFGLRGKEIDEAVACLATIGRTPDGVHVHVGSNLLDPSFHTDVLSVHGGWIKRLRRRCEGRPFTIDLGGGFAASTAGAPPPSFAEYANAAALTFARLGIERSSVEVVIEPGRSLVEDAGWLLTRVCSVKKRRARTIATVDAPGTLVRSALHRNHAICFLGAGRGRTMVDVYGANCFEGDLLGRTLVRGKLNEGRCVAIGGVGGYDLATADDWLRPLPPVLANQRERWTRTHRREKPNAR